MTRGVDHQEVCFAGSHFQQPDEQTELQGLQCI